MTTTATERRQLPGLGEARVQERDRAIEYAWEIGESGNKTVLAVLTVSYRKAGWNVFSGEYRGDNLYTVSLRNEEEERGPRFTSRAFMLFSGVGLGEFEAGSRFSRKRLREAGERGYEVLARLYDEGNEQVLAYFKGVG